MELSRLKYYLIWAFILALLWLGNIYPSHAEILNNRFQVQDLSSIREVKKPIDLGQLGLEYWHDTPENMPTEKELIKLTNYLRDMARYLGSSWSVPISLTNTSNSPHLKITDLKKSDDSWTNFTVGYAIKLVSEELEQLKQENTEYNYIDVLVREENNNKYYPVLNIPLSRYCYELLQQINSRSK